MRAKKNASEPLVWQTWQGNERFFCDGYVVAGPNWKAPFGSALLIVAPTAIFLAFPAAYLTSNLSPAIMVFSCILPTMSLIFLFMTAFRDPGIIPRQEPDEEFLNGRKPRTKEVLVNNHRVVIRYNDTCHFYQPPRAHHCSINDNCIERFDHHCPWVGTTIGKRNYRTFLLFVYTTTVLCLYVMGCCLAQLFLVHIDKVNEGYGSDAWNEAVKNCIPALVLLGFTFLFVWFVGGLSAFHCYLVGTNQTTYENFRYNHDDRPNPYNLGLLLNCAEVWCTPIPPGKIDFRAPAESTRAAAAAAAAAAAGSVEMTEEDDVEHGHGGQGQGQYHQGQQSGYDGNGNAHHHANHDPDDDLQGRVSSSDSQGMDMQEVEVVAGSGALGGVGGGGAQRTMTGGGSSSGYVTTYSSMQPGSSGQMAGYPQSGYDGDGAAGQGYRGDSGGGAWRGEQHADDRGGQGSSPRGEYQPASRQRTASGRPYEPPSLQQVQMTNMQQQQQQYRSGPAPVVESPVSSPRQPSGLHPSQIEARIPSGGAGMRVGSKRELPSSQGPGPV